MVKTIVKKDEGPKSDAVLNSFGLEKSDMKCSSDERAFCLMMFIGRLTFLSCIISSNPLG